MDLEVTAATAGTREKEHRAPSGAGTQEQRADGPLLNHGGEECPDTGW
jgi:hypothetical protein